MQTITGEQVLSSCRPDIYDATTMSLSEICSQATAIKKYSTHTSESIGINNTFHVDILSDSKTEIMEYLAAKTETASKNGIDNPFFVMNIDQVFKCFKLWTKLFPTIRPFFAVKANNDPLLLSLFVSFGMGFDCASGEEIRQVLELGALPDSIVFAHPWKMSSHLRYAREKNVSLMTFDHEEELHKIDNDYKDASLLVRIVADDPTAPHRFGEKFGCSVSEACTLVQTAKQLNLNIVGVCFHVGLGSKNPDSFRKAIASSHEIFQYAESIGCHLTILDIGGGYPGTEEEFSLLEEISKTVNSAIAEFFSDRNDLTVIAEPGQFFSRSITSLVVPVMGKKKAPNEGKFEYHINEGVFGTFFVPNALSQTLEIKPIKATPDSICHYPCIIWGPALAPYDKVCETSLPELHTGDWLVCKDMGAYSLATNFCGFLRPKKFYFKIP